ncbi:MAG: hypothetical protein AAF366_12520 [Pseudomonadota bacterium]
MTDRPAWTDPARPPVAPALPYADYFFWQDRPTVELRIRASRTAELIADLAEDIAQIEDEIDKTFDELRAKTGETR